MEIEDTTKPSALFFAQYYDDCEPQNYLVEPMFWRTGIPICESDSEGSLLRVECNPVTLQREQPRPHRGIPVLARDDEADAIIETIIANSAKYGTEIEQRDMQALVQL
jgi:hypothetical protein